ncbi:MAG: GNAT family N-acetyltransferase [Prochlorothrix sp.]
MNKPLNLSFRVAQPPQFTQIWPLFQAILQTGDCYLFRADLNPDVAYQYWFGPEVQTVLAWDQPADRDPQILGFYKIVANQPDRGSHIANASFVVAPAHQGQGIGYQLGQHCIQTATDLGYRALQFNAVVSTNTPAVKLWQKLGFHIVGTLPQAFNHAQLGYVDLYVMFRSLTPRCPSVK